MSAAIKLVTPDQPPPEKPAPARAEILPPPTDPMKVVRVLERELTEGKHLLLRKWRGDFYRYVGPHWEPVAPETLRKWLYERLEHAVCTKMFKGEPITIPWEPDKTKVDKLLDALATPTLIPAGVDAPSWLSTGEAATGSVPCLNGLVDVDTMQVKEATPDYFGTYAIPVEFDEAADEPTEWLKFLRSLWPQQVQYEDDDPLAHDESVWTEDEVPVGGSQSWHRDADEVFTLQEWMGYLVSGRTDLQKGMLLVGPKRSGKGTILRTCSKLVGEVNTSAPTLDKLGQQFGLQKSIGKALMAVGDARLSGNTSTIVERLLSITGQDGLDIDRKYLEPWSGKLTARVMIASNEVPDFRDPSGAIGSRFMVQKMTTSFYDREDIELGDKLDAELPAILLWALRGLQRLNRTGRFIQSETAIEERKAMEESESPIAQFVDAACIVGPDYKVPKDLLFAIWEDWRSRNGYAAANVATFAKMLRAAESTVVPKRGGSDGGRVQMFAGIGLRKSYVGDGLKSGIRIADLEQRAAVMSEARDAAVNDYQPPPVPDDQPF